MLSKWKKDKDLHNTLFVGDAERDEETVPLRDDPGKIRVEGKKQLSKKEIRKLDKDIGDKTNLFERLKRSTNLFTLLAILLVVAGIYFYSALISVSKPGNELANEDDGSATSTFERAPDYSFDSTNFIAFFNKINDAVFYEGYTWAASSGGLVRYNDLGAVFYGALDGLSGEIMTSLAIAGDDLWVGYQGGVAKYQPSEDVFNNYLTGTNNGIGVTNSELYWDEVSKILMLSTETAFYIYNDDLDSWHKHQDSNAPFNVANFASNSEGVFAVNKPHEDGASEIRLFNRNSKTWSIESLSQLEDETLQVFDVDGQVVALGEEANSLSTRYYHRRDNNWWQIDSFSSHMSKNASYLIGPQTNDDKRVRVEVDASTKDIHKVSYIDGKFMSERVEESYSSGPIDDKLFEPIKQAISESSTLKPHYDLLEIETGGALIATHKSDDLRFGADGALYIRNGFDQALEILDLDQGSTFIPIMCQSSAGRVLTYAFSGKYDAFNDEWDNARMFEFDGEELEKIRDLDEEEVDGPWDNLQFICTDSTIVWPGNGTLWSMSRVNNKVTKQDDLPDKELVGVNDTTRYFFLWDRQSVDSHVYRYDVLRKELVEIDLGKEIERGEDVSLANDLLWVPSTKSETIHVFNLEGEQIKEIIHEGVNGVEILAAGPSKVLIVQSIKDRIYEKHFVFMDTESFIAEVIPSSVIPAAASTLIDVDSDRTVFDSNNSKLWVSGISFSIFALDID